jgi:hypothetical protein
MKTVAREGTDLCSTTSGLFRAFILGIITIFDTSHIYSLNIVIFLKAW